MNGIRFMKADRYLYFIPENVCGQVFIKDSIYKIIWDDGEIAILEESDYHNSNDEDLVHDLSYEEYLIKSVLGS